MKKDLAPALAVLLAAGCAEPPPPAPPPAPTATAAVELPPDPKVHVVAVVPPAKIVIDGDLGEWGPLHAPAGGSALAFAITGDALVIAAELGSAARDGVWLGVGSPAPAVPPIGDWARGGGILKLDCEHPHDLMNRDWVPNASKVPAEVEAACRRLVARHAELEMTYAARFAKRFRVDREGVRLVSKPGELVAIEGATAAWKPGDAASRVEISLPLRALPRLVEAPLTALGVWAAPVTAPAPEVELAKAMVRLPAPVAFEPHADLRAHVFASVGPGFHAETYYPSVGLSYQPGDPLHVESLHYAGSTAIAPIEEALYEKKATLGEIEVGYVTGFRELLAIHRKGKLTAIFDADPSCWKGTGLGHPCGLATRRGVVVRDGEIHVLTYYAGQTLTMDAGVGDDHPGGWLVTAISADGEHRLLPIETIGRLDGAKAYARFDTGAEYANDGLDAFGWRGDAREKKAKKRERVDLEAAYRWDEAKKKYTVTWKRLPAARPKAKKK